MNLGTGWEEDQNHLCPILRAVQVTLLEGARAASRPNGTVLPSYINEGGDGTANVLQSTLVPGSQI